MHKLSKFLKQQMHPQPQLQAAQPQTSAPSLSQDMAFPTELDFYRYRKQRGINLGSWFVLERWIADSPFRLAAAPGQSDLDVARGANAQAVLEQHWDTWITEDDWAWIAQRGINTVRLPVSVCYVLDTRTGSQITEGVRLLVAREIWRVVADLENPRRHVSSLLPPMVRGSAPRRAIRGSCWPPGVQPGSHNRKY